MAKVVLDSSVLVSAFLTPQGASGQILDAAGRQEFRCCLSDEIMAETHRSLRTKVKRIRRYYAYTDEKIDGYVESLAAQAEVVRDLPDIGVVPLDRKDDVIVATAIKAQADFLVTGDRHLLALGSHGPTEIITPRQLLDRLAAQRNQS